MQQQQQQQLLLDYIQLSVYELSELKEWYKGEDELEVVLYELVSNGKLCHRTVTQNDMVYNLYWSNKDTRPATPSQATPTVTTPTSNKVIPSRRQPLSIKRNCFTSPLLRKRQRLLPSDNEGLSKQIMFTTGQQNSQPLKDTDQQRKDELMQSIKIKQEQLRRLKMVQLYKSKHDLGELQALIQKWREISQEAAHQLYDISNHPEKSLKQLLDCMNIDYKIIHYSENDEEFY